MIAAGTAAPRFSLPRVDGGQWELAPEQPALVVFFETDCPTCLLTLPYLDRLSRALGRDAGRIVAISQDSPAATRRLVDNMPLELPVVVDQGLEVSRCYDPPNVPALFLIDASGQVVRTDLGFDKAELNALGAALANSVGRTVPEVASPYDGAPARKPGCASRHLEPATAEPEVAEPSVIAGVRSERASRIEPAGEIDLEEYCMQAFGDPLPVVPPTEERVERMLRATRLSPGALVALVPPNYGRATAEKVAANAVMAGCEPRMMPVLIATLRAACDERFNLHGVQATTHFATPLVVVNGPVREQLGFASGSNVFSNVARANSTLGRALALLLGNVGGARPGEIDMSTLGNPGKFSYVIAEREEESPWQPFHVELGFPASTSTVTLFAAEPPRGVSEHTARSARGVLRAISRTLATVWSYRMCLGQEAFVILGPEHARTIARDGFSKADARDFLYENTGVPVREFEDADGDGTQHVGLYEETTIGGERCYRKFQRPDAIHLIVAGGTAGKFSAVIGSWATGPRGSQCVSYAIDQGDTVADAASVGIDLTRGP